MMNTSESQPTPMPPTSDNVQKNVNKGCLGCLGVFILMIFGGFLVDQFGLNEPQETEGQRIIRETAGASNPIAQRIKSLNSSTAYNAGMQDGMRDVASAAGKLSMIQSDMQTELYNLKNAKNSFFDLLATQNQFDPTVFREYCRGWNDGWDSMHRIR